MSTITLRFDDETKEKIDKLCDSLAEQCKKDLFNARQNAINNGTADMTLDEINKVIYV